MTYVDCSLPAKTEKTRAALQQAAVLVAIGAACSCGGAAGTSGAPAPSEPVPTEITISITATGFKPKDSIVAVGGRARFENVDNRLHSVASNPLISHADCPPINEVGTLVPGQSKMTGVFTDAKTCGYHDPASEGSGEILMGTITVRQN